MQWQVLRVEPCGGQELQRLHPSHPLPACQSTDQPLEPRGKSPRAGAWAPTASILHLCRCPLPREGVGGTCIWPGQERKVIHTKFNNQQRHILAGPLLAPGRPTPQPAVSLACTELASRARREGSGPTLRQSVEAPSVAPPGPQVEGRGGPGPPAPALGLPRLRLAPSRHGPPSLGRLTMAAVSELAVLSNLQFGGVGGGDAVTGLHAVPLFQLRQGAHEAGVGGVQ